MTDAIATVRRFLDALEARDLDTARALTAPGFAMVFPGDRRMDSLEALVAWSAPRYRFVRKTHDRFDRIDDPATGRAVVYVLGTLRGEWPDGSAFAGIRYVDRFELDAEGRIDRQEVWNDMAETRAQQAAAAG